MAIITISTLTVLTSDAIATAGIVSDSLVVDAVTPMKIGAAGGTRFVLVGTFPLGVPLYVYAGLLGTPSDAPCHSGKTKQGWKCYSLDGQTLVAYTPNLEAGGPYSITVSTGYQEKVLAGVLTVLKNCYASGVWALRKVLPPTYDVGVRSFDQLRAV